MASKDNRIRSKWQDKNSENSIKSEITFFEVFKKHFKNTDYEIRSKPNELKNIYVNVLLSLAEKKAIYNPPAPITKHGIVPDYVIINKKTNKKIYIEVKRQDGWIEGKNRSAGRGNAHERLCKYFTPGLLEILYQNSKIKRKYLPFWIVFQGDITRDPCRVREITFWFSDKKDHYFFWRPSVSDKKLIYHFKNHIKPMLD